MEFTLDILGMTCGGCVRSVEKALAGVEGLRSAQVDLASGRAVVEAETGSDPRRFLEAIENAGYDAGIAV